MRLVTAVSDALDLCACCADHRRRLAEAATVAALLHLAQLDDAGMLAVLAQLDRIKRGEAPQWTD